MSGEANQRPNDGGLIAELRRRRVFRVVGAYVLVAWTLMQAGEIVFPAFELPNRALRWLILGLAAGFPLVIFAAWWIDVTPEGFRLTRGRAAEAPVGEGEAQGETSSSPPSLEMIVLGIGLPLAAFALFVGLLLISPDTRDRLPFELASGRRLIIDDSRTSLAVLPLQDFSSSSEEGSFFARGMHEDILTHLARLEGLRLISSHSVASYAGTTKPIAQIAEELGVGHILEGSIRRSETAVRVTAKLIDVDSEEQVWTEQFDAELKDIFAIQTRIAKAIAAALDVHMQDGSKSPADPSDSVSPAAYDAYAKARDLHRNADASRWSALQRSQILYEEACREDPSFAAAWLNLGILHAEVHWFGFDRSPSREEAAVRAVNEATRLGIPADQQALAEGIIAYYLDQDLGKALMLFEQSAENAQSNREAIFYKALVLRRQGALEEALAAHRQAIELDPRSLIQHEEWALTLAMAGQFEEAMARLDYVLGRDAERVRVQLQRWQFEAELSGKASVGIAGVEDTAPTRVGFPHQRMMFVYAAVSGEYERGLKWLRETPTLPGDVGSRELRLAVLSRFAGRDEDAVGWLARAETRWSLAIAGRPRERWSDLEVQVAAGIAAEHGDFAEAVKLLESRADTYPIEKDLVAGAPMFWDWIVMLLRADYVDEAIDGLERLTDQLSLGSVPFAGHLILERWPDLVPLRQNRTWQAALSEIRPDYASNWPRAGVRMRSGN